MRDESVTTQLERSSLSSLIPHPSSLLFAGLSLSSYVNFLTVASGTERLLFLLFDTYDAALASVSPTPTDNPS
jgi:hypothetical protein